MSQEEKRWIVKESEGKIWGPYSTAQILEQIDRGYYVGGEQVAAFPGGQWVAISKTPEFYDRLLDVLVQEGQKQLPEPETVYQGAEPTEKGNVGPGDPAKTGSAVRVSNTSTGAAATDVSRRTNAVDGKTGTSAGLTSKTSGTKTSTTKTSARGLTKTGVTNALATSASALPDAPNVELTDIKELEEKESGGGRASKAPMIFIALALLLAIVAIFMLDEPGQKVDGTRIHLLAPRKGQPDIGEAKSQEKFKRALAAFQTDTFSQYQRAQNELVEIVEGAGSNIETAGKKAERIATLCLTYRELWPYAYQDAKDLKTLSLATQEAKRFDPGGKSGATCEIVELMLTGRARDAQGLTDNMLVEESQTPILFEIRGDLYAYVKDYSNAANYFDQARVQWPAWQKISVEAARAKKATQKFPEAVELLRAVIQKVPSHPVAKIELGLMEAFVFQHPDDGLSLLRTALDGKEKMPREIESNGWLGMARIHEQKNLSAKASDYASRAYEVNPANVDAKAMVERLHGRVSEPGPKEAQGLIFLGEQYFSQGDFFAAQAQFKTAFEADPKSGIAAMKAGRCLWALNQSLDAIDWMKKAIAADPQLTSAYIYLAEYYARRYDFSSATAVLAKIQRLQPNSYEVYRGLANVELIRNNYNGALQYGQRSLKLYETDLETYLIMAKANMGLRKFQDAQRFAARAIELDYNNIEAQSLYGKSEAGLRGIESGVSYMRGLINRFVITKGQQVPQAAIEFRISLGDIYMMDERYMSAEENYQQAIALDPDNKKALVGLAKSLQAQNQQARSLEAFLRAAVLDPSDADPIFYSGNLYAEVGKLKEALKQYERVLKINSRYPRAHFALGQMYLRQGQPKEALAEAMKERELNPGLRDSFTLAAESYFALKQYSNCAAEYQQGARGKRESGLLVRMARCYRLSGALDSAQSLLREAQSIESGNPEVYKEQGAIFHTKGMADEAIAAYDTYLKLVPAAVDRSEIENRMRRVRSGDLDVGP